MAIEKEYTLKLSTEQAQANVDELNKSLEAQADLIDDIKKEIIGYEKQLKKTSQTDLAARKSINDKIKVTKERLNDEKVALKDVTKDRKRANKTLKDTSTEVDNIGDSAKNSKKGFSIMGVGINSVGGAFKALGIGLIVAAIAGLTEAFSRNKRVMDGVEVVLTTVGNVFSQITNAIVNTYDAVAKSSENFDALGKVISGLLTLGFAPLKIAFYGIIAAAEGVKLAYEQMFGDDASIAKAQANLDETNEKLKQIAIDTNKAGRDIAENFSEAIDEVSSIATIASEEFSKVSIKNAKAQADNYKAAKDAAILAQAESSALRAAYELEAAELKKIRDNVNLSLQDRIKANNDLAITSALVEEQMKRQAQLAVNLAALEVQRNNSSENQAALIQANADLKAVEADIAGKTEEIETNRVGLLNEQNALLQTQIDGERERNLVKAEFEAEQEEDPLVKLQLQRDILDAENLMILEDIEAKREIYALGTQARVDAEENFKNEKLRIDNEIVTNTKESANTVDKINAEASANEISWAEMTLDEKLGLISDGFNNLAKILGEESAAGKAAAIAAATISTFQGAISSYTSLSGIPVVGPVLGALAAGAAVASGVANIKKIAQTKTPGPSVSAPTPSAAQAPSLPPAPPAFNVVGQSDTNQLADAIGMQEQQPIQAFVVSSEVTTAQELDRNIINDASIG